MSAQPNDKAHLFQECTLNLYIIIDGLHCSYLGTNMLKTLKYVIISISLDLYPLGHTMNIQP